MSPSRPRVSSPARAGSRTGRVAVALTVIVFVATALTSLLRPTSSTLPYAVNNPGGDGAQALAALLADEGVDVVTASSPAAAIELANEAGDATIALLHAGELEARQRADLAHSGHDVTVLGVLYQDLSALSKDELSPAGTSAPSTTALSAQCEDPDARAAATIEGSVGSLSLAGTTALGCFPLPASAPATQAPSPSAPGDDAVAAPDAWPSPTSGTRQAPGGGAASPEDAGSAADSGQQGDGAVGGGTLFAYAVTRTSSGAHLRVIADPSILTNARLASAGHAALGVRALGHHSTLVWYDAAAPSPAPLLWSTRAVPGWLPVLALQGLFTLAVVALVRGRRFGPLVREDLPAPVLPSETTIGRARLYRAGGARAHAARILRTGTCTRLASALAVARTAPRADLVDAVVRATGRPASQVRDLLAGPPPPDDRALAALAIALDTLENEVHHHDHHA